MNRIIFIRIFIQFIQPLIIFVQNVCIIWWFSIQCELIEPCLFFCLLLINYTLVIHWFIILSTSNRSPILSLPSTNYFLIHTELYIIYWLFIFDYISLLPYSNIFFNIFQIVLSSNLNKRGFLYIELFYAHYINVYTYNYDTTNILCIYSHMHLSICTHAEVYMHMYLFICFIYL